MSKARVVVTGRVTIFQLAALTFVVLKLTGVVAWSWWWVLSPVWAPLALAAVVFAASAAFQWIGRRV